MYVHVYICVRDCAGACMCMCEHAYVSVHMCSACMRAIVCVSACVSVRA